MSFIKKVDVEAIAEKQTKQTNKRPGGCQTFPNDGGLIWANSCEEAVELAIAEYADYGGAIDTSGGIGTKEGCTWDWWVRIDEENAKFVAGADGKKGKRFGYKVKLADWTAGYVKITAYTEKVAKELPTE